MTDLSPAAQTVLEAVHLAIAHQQANLSGVPDYRQVTAAALRAAADQVVPTRDKPGWEHELVMGEWQEGQRIRFELLAIAAELEGAQ